MPNQKNIKNVELLVDKLAKAKSIYFTDYLGLNVSEVTALRKKFFENNVEYLVVKNTLLKIASEKNKIELSAELFACLLYTSPSPRDATLSRMPSSA